MRVTWLWAPTPDDETGPTRSVPQARSSARRTPRSRIDTTTSTSRPGPTEGNPHHV